MNELLSRHTTFRIGGPAAALFTADSRENLKRVLAFARVNRIAWKVIGAGSNLLVSDQGFPGIVIKLGAGFAAVDWEKSAVHVGAGVPLAGLVDESAARELTGLEFLWGIPGTLGGSVKTNAGAFGRCIGDQVVEARVASAEGKETTLRREDLKFGYRRSDLPGDAVVTDVTLSCRKSKPDDILRRIEECRQQRLATQPKGASAGCFFRNPRGQAAGRLIDQAGMKGRRIGDAVVSDRHANFILNQGRAQFSDVYQLMELIKLEVEKKFGVVLEEETEILAEGIADAR
jgi:UDP-N-acetylmuramate dehydrogenase